ncbi:PEP-CTERM sorting domain-containing protein [Verrucomicrobiaceae bacterium N1E253]|uniref:PEP-CTERM sorting domain-containing protein n=1 Tax=Oceaniferula marina TaxID=2748318 RepID=A0A851GDN7_9BACT|nr:PEP-CTERM sorting domain-containing protein [Oceaniferula marina]NWK55052.1 PEP-CTERM sorting domain-containing protein [Oceaniferula marina]
MKNKTMKKELLFPAIVMASSISISQGALVLANGGFEDVTGSGGTVTVDDTSVNGDNNGILDDEMTVSSEGTINRWDGVLNGSANKVSALGSYRGNTPNSSGLDTWAVIEGGTLTSGNSAQLGQNIGLIGDLTAMTVTFDLTARAASSQSLINDVRVSVFAGTAGTAGWVTELASVTFDASEASGLVTNTGDIMSTGGGESVYLASQSVTLDTFNSAGANTNVWLVFTTVGDATNGQTLIDNVSIASVPEPSSAALLGLGGVTLILRRRK